MMKPDLLIRPSAARDAASIETLYREAFPEEDLLALVQDLLRRSGDVLSLVAVGDDSVLGHVAFTRCRTEGSGADLALLAPLAVAPAAQRQGLGSRLVREGLARLGRDGVDLVLVLGSPAYYGRFGFVEESAVAPPYPLPAEWLAAWQSLRLGTAAAPCGGKLVLPEPWLRPALWAP